MEKPRVLAVVGPTASGKTALGVMLARRFGGEVISADSMQIYEGLDIATAKPTAEEMQGVPHHLIGVIPRSQRFSAAEYAALAHEKIREVTQRGHLPILVGGTGLYVDTVLGGMRFGEGEDPAVRESLREALAQEGSAALHARLAALDPQAAAAIHPNNTVRVIRALEVCLVTDGTFTQYKAKNAAAPSPYDSLILGLSFEPRQLLYDRIDRRVERMLEQGLVEEVRAAREDTAGTAAAAIGFKELLPYLDGEASLDECVARIQLESRRYAKRQLTWFRRNAQISWLIAGESDEVGEISEKAEKIIAKTGKMCYNE
ncbi:MAG: tRNA (adenosine(37)-N6)-dimethylallyltransferase MiaA [Oscillospiraceae bacterium]|nr:tRNA (adenosine(37)-N6)-dimethylallyltransferase MiaA [Oscillospiraceae bacterium]